jgi:hypothetical protein
LLRRARAGEVTVTVSKGRRSLARLTQVLVAEAARILVPDGYLLLGHTDFDTLGFSATTWH